MLVPVHGPYINSSRLHASHRKGDQEAMLVGIIRAVQGVYAPIQHHCAQDQEAALGSGPGHGTTPVRPHASHASHASHATLTAASMET